MNNFKYSAVLFTALLFSATAIAQGEKINAINGNSGTISFKGAVVNSPCQFFANHKRIISSCWENINGKSKEKINIIDVNNFNGLIADRFSSTQFQWIGKNKKAGIITILYR